MSDDRHEPELTVPDELERDHLAEARRIVARSHRRPLVRSRSVAPAPRTPTSRARRAAYAAHGFALLLLVLLALLTDIWGIAAAMGGVVLISLGVVLRTIAALSTPPSSAGDRTRLRTDRSG